MSLSRDSNHRTSSFPLGLAWRIWEAEATDLWMIYKD